MANAIVNAIWKNGPKDKNARYLLVVIADHANDSGEAFPGLETLVNWTRMSRSTVIRAMKLLVSEGWMTVRERRLARKTYATGNLYCLSLVKLRVGCASAPKVVANNSRLQNPLIISAPAANPRASQLSPTETVVGVRVTPAKPRQQAPRRCQNGPSVGVRVTPEPSLEPKQPPCSPPTGGPDPDLRAWGTEALKREIAELLAKKKTLTPRSPEYFPIGGKLLVLREELEKLEPPPPPQPYAPMGFQTRRQRRLTQSQMLARVGGEGSCTYSREAQIEASSLVRRLAMQYEARA